MNVAMDSNMGFHQGFFPSSFYNHHVFSFQPGSLSNGAGVVSGGMNGSGGIGGMSGMILAGNHAMFSNSSPMITAGSSSNAMLEPVSGLKHDTVLAVDWSFEELVILKAGLVKYASEQSIMKYIKIAAMLRDKTVRDVALRCRWMTKENGKRRKTDEHCAGKKFKDRKEKMVDMSSNANINPIPPDNMPSYSFLMPHVNQNNRFSSEVPVIDGVTRQLMDENTRVLTQITANLATCQVRDNIDLFCQTRNNITAILNSMSETPGIMCQMPPLPVLINEDLVSTILPGANQAIMFGSPTATHLKQEPRC